MNNNSKLSQEEIKKRSIQFFNATFSDCIDSKSYGRYCESVYGKNLCQFCRMDMKQLEKLLKTLSLNNASKVLDIGCGNGVITEYIANETGASVTGVDFADKAIARATERIKNNKTKIRFINADIDFLDIPGNSFDTIICIDSVGKGENISNTIKKIKTLISKNGQLAFFYSNEVLPQKPKEFLRPDKTDLAIALTKENLKYQCWDFSKEESLLWKRGKKAEIDLKNEFEKEGYMDLYNDIVDDSAEILRAIEEGRHCRYLYYVKI